ncbi:MAG: Crp/Fnr family transcriptional regulator [Ruminococcaceae bacterium]|nr:Crp/Fnr family transcriptional regulator [Oscillospiraceae bacterium]
MSSTAYEDLYREIFPFWQELSREEQELFCRNTVARTVYKGENIHGGQGECTGVIIVRKGSLRTYLLSEEGREITLYRLFPGEFCMLSASCVLKTIEFDVMVDAEEDGECYIVNGKVFSELTENNLRIQNFALETAVERFSDVMWVMQQILFMSYDRRLAIFLWDEMVKTNSTRIYLTHEQIARYTGSAREVVTRMLKYFAAEQMVSLFRGGIEILDKKKLKILSNPGQ